MLYTDSSSAEELVMVPNLVGFSASEVNNVASAYGLNVSFTGAVSSGGVSTSQDIASGEMVSPGTVITVAFTSSNTTFHD